MKKYSDRFRLIKKQFTLPSWRTDHESVSDKLDEMSVIRRNIKEFDIESFNTTGKLLLLKFDFDFFCKHFDMEQFSAQQLVSLLSVTERVCDYIDFTKCPRTHMRVIAIQQPELFSQYNIQFTNLTGDAWVSLIDHDPLYKQIFLQNISQLPTKSDLRYVLNNYPELIEKLTLSDFENSLLTAKQWILLLGRKKITVSDEIKEWLDMAFNMEVMIGESTTTTYTKHARKQQALS